MHIPDGYLSPATCVITTVLAAPACMVSSRILQRRMSDREAPLLAAGAAFCFVIMMLNVPVPGGTTAHAVGGTLLAIVMGPAAAILALTVTLVIQGLLFHDGGITTLGANILNMAVILPLAGYAVYRTLSDGVTGWRWKMPRPIAAAVGGYVGINLAALAAAIELGIQPVLYHTVSGIPRYCPYSLAETIPAMMLAHLTVAGIVEAGVTGRAIAYLVRARSNMLAPDSTPAPAFHIWVWRVTALFALLCPLGLLATGGAFAEYSTTELRSHFGFLPTGLSHLSGIWRHALMPGYAFPSTSGHLLSQVGGYYASVILVMAILGIIAVAANKWHSLHHSHGSTDESQMPDKAS